MSNNHTSGPESGSAHNGNSALTRREARLSDTTGTLPSLQVIGPEQSTSQNASDFEQMVQSLHDLFEQDRQIASHTDVTRCGICYLHFHVNELQYRDEGFYVCANCAHSLGHQRVTIVRKQQKL